MGKITDNHKTEKMNHEKELTRKGRELAFLLRHDADAFDKGLIDSSGWRSVSELEKSGFTRTLLDEIVRTNDKKRYEFSQDGRKIRARQGHSIGVDVGLEEAVPPETLYHGTSRKAYYESIVREGLRPMSRLHVHLSPDEATARKVGSRHGADPLVIVIDAGAMHRDRIKLYLSNNGVWLTGPIDTKYFLEII